MSTAPPKKSSSVIVNYLGPKESINQMEYFNVLTKGNEEARKLIGTYHENGYNLERNPDLRPVSVLVKSVSEEALKVPCPDDNISDGDPPFLEKIDDEGNVLIYNVRGSESRLEGKSWYSRNIGDTPREICQIGSEILSLILQSPLPDVLN